MDHEDALKVNFDKEFAMITNSPDDPRFKKKWGFITALPSEYLIHFKKGKIQERSSGQGATCFKMFRDTVFIIPTSLKEIVFKANQLTLDNVDIKIRGMVVYRINNPQQIYKLINFSNRSLAEEKLGHVIADMCRSNVKELVATLKVEDCIRKRKHEIADTLKQSLSTVVSKENDGWGVEIVTVNVQDIFIQDYEIFNAIQMSYKSETLRQSRLSELQTQKEIEIRELENERYLSGIRKTNELERQAIESEVKNNKIDLDRNSQEKEFNLKAYNTLRESEIENQKTQKEIENEKQKVEFSIDRQKKETETQKILHEEELDFMKKKLSIESGASEYSLQKEFIEKALPEIASALANNMNHINYSVYQGSGDGNGSPLYFMIQQIIDIMNKKVK